MSMTPTEARIRGFIYLSIAAITAILADDYLRSLLPKIVQSILWVLGAILGAYRLYIDQSPAQSKIPASDSESVVAIDEN